MKGVNKLNLNYETMVDAVQEYLDKRFVTPPIVKSLSTNVVFNNSSVHSGTMFVEIQEPVAFLKGEEA